ncbi:hypothetical protein HZA98_03915 [Candidatus Woesearchaeota archaeon]|nr:hypothetical protein [Candidatus Woesearchaeota archaeon]
MSLSYNDLQLPVYRNTRPIIILNAKQDGKPKRLELSLSDLVAAAEISGLNIFFVSDTGMGKTQLVRDIYTTHFGGEAHGNFLVGRPETRVMDLFERQQVDLSSGKYDSDAARQLSDRTKAAINVVDEINRAPPPVQVDFFDLAMGDYAFKGRPIPLGEEGYALFLATANMNKSGDNGFSGTFAMDRALLNRMPLTIDIDNKAFQPTTEDKIAIHHASLDPRIKSAEPRDLTQEILAAHKQIASTARQQSIEADLFSAVLDKGLDYCRQDKLNQEKQGTFPMKCLECPHGKDICSATKHASERSIQSILMLAKGMSHMLELKYGEVEMPLLDVLTEAYRFTAFHGNLNDITLEEKYAGRRQLMMDALVGKIRAVVQDIQPHVFYDEAHPQGTFHPELVECTVGGKRSLSPKTESLTRLLRQRSIPFTERNLQKRLEDQGIGADWVGDFAKVYKE